MHDAQSLFTNTQAMITPHPVKITGHVTASRAARICPPAARLALRHARPAANLHSSSQISAVSQSIVTAANQSAETAAASGSTRRISSSSSRRVMAAAASANTELAVSWEETTQSDQYLMLVMSQCRSYTELAKFLVKHKEECKGKFAAFILLVVSHAA